MLTTSMAARTIPALWIIHFSTAIYLASFISITFTLRQERKKGKKSFPCPEQYTSVSLIDLQVVWHNSSKDTRFLLEIHKFRGTDFLYDLLQYFSAELDTAVFNDRLKQVAFATHVHSSPFLHADKNWGLIKIWMTIPAPPLCSKQTKSHGPPCHSNPKGFNTLQ